MGYYDPESTPGRRFIPPYLPQGQEDPSIIAPGPRKQDYPQGDEYGTIPQRGPALTPLSPPPSERDASVLGQLWQKLAGMTVPGSGTQRDMLPPSPNIPGSEDKNRFWNPDSNTAPYNAPGVKDDRSQQASGGFLNNILGIGSAQAAEKPLPAGLTPDKPAPPGLTPDVGLLTPGNIDLNARPIVKNPDGSISTVRSMSFNADGKEILIPTVAADGSRILSDEEAIDQYRKTGQFLGTFDTPEHATAYAQALHQSQAARYAQPQQSTLARMGDTLTKGIGRANRGLMQGVMDPVYGGAQIGARMPNEGDMLSPTAGQADPAQIKAVDTATQQREQQYQQQRQADQPGTKLGTDWARLVGNVVSPVNVAEGAALGAAAPAGIAGRIGLGAAGGALGALSQPATSDNFGKEKLEQIGAGAAVGGALGTGAHVLAKAIGDRNPAQVDQFVTSQYRQGVKPGSQDDVQILSGVKSILDNKPNLQYEMPNGNLTKGEKPQNLEQFRTAIGQTKVPIFKQYDAMARAAGQNGQKVPLGPVADELDTFGKDIVLQDNFPDTARYATRMAKTLRTRGEYSTVDTQRAIENYNASLKAFYRAPDYKKATQALVDSMIANKLRVGLDDTVAQTEGAGYQALKNQYGALRALEDKVVRAADRDAQKTTGGGGLFGTLMNVTSAHEALTALATLNPATAVKAGLLRGVAAYARRQRDPNRAIQRLFDAAERGPTAGSATSRILPALTPVAGAEAGSTQ